MKRLVIVAFAAISLFVSILAWHAAPALAASAKEEVCSGIGAASGAKGCEAPKGSPTVNSVINTVINIMSAFVGILAVLMIIFSGFRYVTAGGDSGKISQAKNTLIYAIVGVVVAGVSQLLVRYVVVKVL
jgi:hypothetical protein